MIRSARKARAGAIGLLALSVIAGGAAYAATSGTSTIHACAKKHGGALRLAKKCKHSERALTWAVQGRQGVPGQQGSPGTPGPGATSFDTTLSQGISGGTLQTLPNGVKLTGTCTNGPANVGLGIGLANNSDKLQMSGTVSSGSSLVPTFVNSAGGATSASDFARVTYDVIARDSSHGGFYRLDLHGEFGLPCEFWGMVTPSTVG